MMVTALPTSRAGVGRRLAVSTMGSRRMAPAGAGVPAPRPRAGPEEEQESASGTRPERAASDFRERGTWRPRTGRWWHVTANEVSPAGPRRALPVRLPSAHPSDVLACDHGRRQVSWLAGPHPFAPPSQDPSSQWHRDEGFAAYSCGGSCRIGPEIEPATAFPFDPRGEPSGQITSHPSHDNAAGWKCRLPCPGGKRPLPLTASPRQITAPSAVGRGGGGSGAPRSRDGGRGCRHR
jgi:hypothetical protein